MDKFKTDKFKCQIKFKRTLWPHRLSTPDRFIFSMSFFVLVKDDQFLSFDTLSQVTKTCYGQYWTPDVCKCPSVCVWISSILSVKRSNASIFWSSLIQNVVTVNVQKKKKKKNCWYPPPLESDRGKPSCLHVDKKWEEVPIAVQTCSPTAAALNIHFLR